MKYLRQNQMNCNERLNMNSVKEALKHALQHPATIIQAFFVTWLFFSLLFTAMSYSDFVRLEPIVAKEFMGALLTVTATVFGFFGALIVLEIQLADRRYDEQHRIAMDCYYKYLELYAEGINSQSKKKMWSELDKILEDAKARTKETLTDVKYFKKFAKILIGVFLLAILFLIGSYAQLSSSVSFPNAYNLSWFALMMTLGAFTGFGLLLLAILS